MFNLSEDAEEVITNTKVLKVSVDITKDDILAANTASYSLRSRDPSTKDRELFFQEMMTSISDLDGARKWQCLICSKMTKLKGDMLGESIF